jgi:uncharacterized membrane protein YesL
MNNLTPKENPVLYWFSKMGDFCALSILWLLLCLPVVTAIPASIALFDSVAHCIHGTEDGSVRRFFRTFKSELLRGILLSLVWLGIGAALLFGYNILYQMGKEDPAMAAYSMVYLFTMVIPLGVLAWLIPVESRFHHSFLGLFRTAAVYAICYLPTTILLVALFVLAIVMIYFATALVLVLPAIVVTIQCRFVERIFSKYIPQEEEADE